MNICQGGAIRQVGIIGWKVYNYCEGREQSYRSICDELGSIFRNFAQAAHFSGCALILTGVS